MHKTYQIYILVITSILFSHFSWADNFIRNGSFEGTPGIENIPEFWQAGCGSINTPDTQPGWWNVELPPQDGETYLDLLYKEDGTKESVYQELENPLPAGSCFLIEIHLAQACQDSISNLYHFDLNNPGDLVIRGSSEYSCTDGKVLGTFEADSNCRWRKYYAVFQAYEVINFIYLEFSKGSQPEENGSILIDNFVLDFTTPFPEEEYTVDYGQSLTLSALIDSEAELWTLNTGETYEDTSSIHPIFNQNTKVELEYWSADSCLIFQSYNILVNPIIPNIITSDNDGINDAFIIRGLSEDTRLTVLNRWGDYVYLSNHYYNQWIPQGLADGVYFYVLELKETGRVYRGSLTIL